MRILREILKELKEINKHLSKLSDCVDNNNYRGKDCLVTGHWND